MKNNTNTRKLKAFSNRNNNNNRKLIEKIQHKNGGNIANKLLK